MPKLESITRLALCWRRSLRPAVRITPLTSSWLQLAIAMIFSFALLGQVDTVSAEHTILHLEFEPTITLGESVTVMATLSSLDGSAIADEPISISVNNQQLAIDETDDAGQVIFSLKPVQLDRAADYTVRASFEGSTEHGTTQSAGILTVQPVMFSVQTVPPLAGIRFALGDRLFVSDSSGLAQIAVDEAGTLPLTTLLPTPQTNQLEDVAVLFALWQDGFEGAIRPITIPSTTAITAGFEVSRRVALQFETTNSETLSPSRVDALTLTDSLGRTRTILDINQESTVLLPTSTIVKTATGLQANPIGYTLTELIVDDSNALQGSEQQFVPEWSQEVLVKTVLYSVVVSAEDLFFGRPLGQTVLIEYPDGTVKQYPIGPHGRVEVTGLARGTYFATILRAQGYAARTPFTVAQNQTVNLSIVSYLDLAIILVGLFLLLVGWVSSTRPLWLQPFGRKLFGQARSSAIVYLMRTNRFVWTATVTILMLVTIMGLFTAGSIIRSHYATRPDDRWSFLPASHRSAEHPVSSANPSAGVVILTRSQIPAPTLTPTAIVVADFPQVAATPTPIINNAIPPLLTEAMVESIHFMDSTPDNYIHSLAAPTTAASTTEPSATPSPTTRIHLVRDGETLVQLATLYYNDGNAWERIWQANRETLGNSPEITSWDILIIP